MEDKAILKLFQERDESAITRADQKYGKGCRDDVEVPPDVYFANYETEEDFYKYRKFVMTVEEFYEAAEVMKEKYFTNGWKSSE